MINAKAIEQAKVEALLGKFPERYRDKLRSLTGHELYYAYKILTYNMSRKAPSSRDVFVLTIKAKLIRWLKETLVPGAYGLAKPSEPVPPAAWEKIGKGWLMDYLAWSGDKEALTAMLNDKLEYLCETNQLGRAERLLAKYDDIA